MRFGRSLPRLSTTVRKPVFDIQVFREALFPDAILVQTALTGAVTDIDEDPDNPDVNWLVGTAAASELRVSFPAPTNTPVTGAGLQEFRIRLRPGT